MGAVNFDFSGWNPTKVLFFEWMLTPEKGDGEVPATQKAFSERHDVAERTLSQWKHSEEFNEAFQELALARFKPRVVKVMDTIAGRAEAGSFNHAKLFMRLMGLYKTSRDVHVTDERGSEEESGSLSDEEIESEINTLLEELGEDTA